MRELVGSKNTIGQMASVLKKLQKAIFTLPFIHLNINTFFIDSTKYSLHVCTVHQRYQGTFLLFQTDPHNYKIIGILKYLKFRLSLRHVSVHAGTIIRELFRV